MTSESVTYIESGYFPRLICDYLNQNEKQNSIYNRFPTLENFEFQIQEKKENYDSKFRKILVEAIDNQYKNIDKSSLTSQNIELLKSENTFTITTGHQLNLFSGPLYFIYKIISTINLCKKLKIEYPENNFVPIYWMATEDHDFDEINHFLFKGKKIVWDKESSGAVGRLDTFGLEKVFDVVNQQFGIGKNSEYLKKIFQESYLKHRTLSEATQFLANELFKNEGLVIIDADQNATKKLFIPYLKKELFTFFTEKEVNQTIDKLNGYDIQVNPRNINLFYLKDKIRERIIFEEGYYKINNTNLQFTPNEIEVEIENFPERFSPNVLLRPLYQEVILPNLAYIGGGGEIAYWLELKSVFDVSNITFPMLIIRDSVVLASKKQISKMEKLNLNWYDLFLKPNDLETKKAFELSEFPIQLKELKEILEKQFEYLQEISNKTDKSFIGALKAQEVKQKNGLDHLEKKLLRAQKKNLHDKIERTLSLQKELFPNGKLQERINNFSEFYLSFGNELFPKLFEQLNPLDFRFKIIEL